MSASSGSMQLALGYINLQRTSPPESILQAWDRSGHRRLALAFRDHRE